MMTPCEERGWKVGDKFVLVKPTDSVEKGDRLELIRDDGTFIPQFRCSGGEDFFLYTDYVEKIEGDMVADTVYGRINWDESPEDATHFHRSLGWIKRTPLLWYYWGGSEVGCGWVQIGDQENFENECVQDLIGRPLEPDLPMKQTEGTTMKSLYPEYYKDVSELDEMDVYMVHEVFQIQDSSGCLQHASKKILLSGVRTGGKPAWKDIKEARDTLTRKLQIMGVE